MRAQFITASEVAEIMGISRSKAYQIVREMNRELKAQGYLTVAGKCPAQYFKQSSTASRFPEVSAMTGNEKTTALIPSVGADGGQPPHNSTKQRIPHETCESNPPEENIEEIRERIRRMNDPHYLHTVSMTELYQTTYKSRPPVIDGLLYAGAYILAGAPKIGKSFLVAQLAYHVSTGQRLWGYEVHSGTVLYLALEDDFQRIQSRMFMMYGVADTASLHFATAANKIGNGLDEQLENFIKEHPDTKLVIIDTMQKIREAGGEAYSYASDYEIIGKLKRFADRHSICIVTVHHTRKQPAGDSFETISGTTGLLGCADGALLMQKKKRTALEATVDAVGRDQQDQILYLKKDPTRRYGALNGRRTSRIRSRPTRYWIRFPSLFPPKAENGQAARPSLRKR